jgi:Zn-dependent peptidase ImmA (M78 family)
MTADGKRIEQEANLFALCLLIPRKKFAEALAVYPLDPSYDHNAKILSKMFDVSITAVVMRANILKNE